MIDDDLNKDQLRRKLDELMWKQKNYQRRTLLAISGAGFILACWLALLTGQFYLHIVPIIGWLITLILQGVLAQRGTVAMPLKAEDAHSIQLKLQHLHIRTFMGVCAI